MRRRRHFGPIMLVLMVAEALLSGCQSQDVSNRRAAEGRGILERPTAVQNVVRPRRARAFQQASADSLSRDLFDADDQGKVGIHVRELCLPPGKGPVTTSWPSVALLEMRTDRGTLKIAGKPQEWKQGSIVMVPPDAQVELTNPTDRELIVRLDVVEVK